MTVYQKIIQKFKLPKIFSKLFSESITENNVQWNNDETAVEIIETPDCNFPTNRWKNIYYINQLKIWKNSK